MKEKWTPGPWAVGEHDKNGQRLVCADIEICTCWHHSVGSIEKQMEANARLIAAAPDLYVALEEMRAACAACFRVIATVDGLADALDIELRGAGVKEGFGTRSATALAKARGEAGPEPESRAGFPPNGATNAEGLTEGVEPDLERDRR